MHTLWNALGVCLGNSAWLAGVIMLGLGVLAIKVKKESVLKVVGVMSMMSGGQPKGPALKLKGLVDPEERTKPLGRRLVVVAIVLLLFGSTMVVKCTGADPACPCGVTQPCDQPCPQVQQMQPTALPKPPAK